MQDDKNAAKMRANRVRTESYLSLIHILAIGVIPPGIGRKALIVFVGVPRFALVVAKAVLEGRIAIVIADAHLFAVVF